MICKAGMKRGSPVAVIAAVVMLGCGSSVTYHANGVVAPRAARDASQMVVQMNGTGSARGVVIAGDMHASGGDSAESIELLRKEAAKNGLDGVTDIVCAPASAADSGSCDAKGFVYGSP